MCWKLDALTPSIRSKRSLRNKTWKLQYEGIDVVSSNSEMQTPSNVAEYSFARVRRQDGSGVWRFEQGLQNREPVHMQQNSASSEDQYGSKMLLVFYLPSWLISRKKSTARTGLRMKWSDQLTEDSACAADNRIKRLCCSSLGELGMRYLVSSKKYVCWRI